MYTYAPLTNADSVRLLRLKGSSDVDSPIELDVFQASLRGSLEYEAVSYAWEGQVPTCAIRCSNEDLLVTENCEAILRQFRPDGGEERTLWIDAICINQAEDASEERNRQVSLMRAIYSGATRTLIWLGSEKRHGGPVVADHMAWLNDVVALAKCGDSKTMREKLLVLGMKSSVIDLKNLLPWFSRLWVVQELALSKCAIFYFGSYEMPFSAMWECQQQYPSSLKEKLQEMFRGHLAGSYFAYGMSSPTRLLMNTIHYDASDPRDKAYAIYGLLGARGMVLPTVDYTKSVADIYRETVRTLIELDQDGTILLNVDGLAKTPGLPSWVADLGHRDQAFWDASPNYPAVRDSQLNFYFKEVGKHISLEGMIIDRVSSRAVSSMAHYLETGPKGVAYKSWTKNELPVDEFWQQLFQSDMTIKDCGSTVLLYNIHVAEDFLRYVQDPTLSELEQDQWLHTLYACLQLQRKEQLQPSVQQDWEAWRAVILRAKDDTITGAEASKRCIDRIEQDEAIIEQFWLLSWTEGFRNRYPLLDNRRELATAYELTSDQRCARIHRWFTSRHAQKTLFKTEKSALGIAIHSIQPGDEVAFISGIPKPMIIRREGQHYRLVSAADLHYVSGQEPLSLEKSQLQFFEFI